MSNIPEVRESAERVRHELEMRQRMVMVMGVTAVWVGIAIMTMGAPDFLEEWLSPWSRYFIGGTAFISGLMACAGLLAGACSRWGWWSQVIALGMMVAFQLFMAVAYTGRVIDLGIFFAHPGEPLNEGVTGRGYVPLLYVGLVLGTLVPMLAMIKNGRPTRSDARPGSEEERPRIDLPFGPGTGPYLEP